MARALVPNCHNTLWSEAWFLLGKYHWNVRGNSDATWGIHVAYKIWGYHISPQVHRQTSSNLQGWLLGSEKTHWWVEHEHGRIFHASLGVMSGQVNVQVAELVHVPQLHVRPKKSMVVWKQIPYDCLWFDADVVLDGDCRRQVHSESTATKIMFGLGENCGSTIAVDKTIVEHWQACYSLQWVLILERNNLVAEEGSVCLGTHQ